MSASTVLNNISAAMQVTAELPLRVFDIKITRRDNDKVCIKLTRGPEVIEVSGKFGKRIKIDRLLINSTAEGVGYATGMCPSMTTINAFTYFTYSVVDAQGEWKSLDPSCPNPPSEKSIATLTAAMNKVAERILTRVSRVDLL